jgi:uncharacterized protein YkwD
MKKKKKRRRRPPLPPPIDWTSFESEVLRLVNEHRAHGGVCGSTQFAPAPPLTMIDTLTKAARLHSKDMYENQYFSHYGQDGTIARDRMRAAGWSGSGSWGENIAQGQRTPDEVVDAWMSSVGHCALILSPNFRFTGIGYATGKTGFRDVWTQVFSLLR